ncbi:MAG: SRPBCC family protein [Gemmatimonadaceae bacterium]|nr:SRPBCC family protein [Gemmatimonadaceae bacterium]
MSDTAVMIDVETSSPSTPFALGQRGSGLCRYSKSAAIRIDCSADKAYRFWRDLANLPLFMRTLQSVEEPYTGTSIWRRRLPGGAVMTWEAELTCDFPGARIAWRSIDETRHFDAGSVRFTPDRDGERTDVEVTIEYEAARSPAALSVANLFRADPGAQLRDELVLLKFALEGQSCRSRTAPQS